MRFSVRVKDAEGVARSFTREANSRDELLNDLRHERCLVLAIDHIRETESEATTFALGYLRPMTSFDVELGLRQIASLLKSGVTLLTSLETIAQEALSPWTRQTWRRLANRVIAGSSLSEALSQESRRFDELVIRLCEVGERSGELEHTLSRAADQLEARRNLRTQVINALVYPLIAVTMAVGVSAFLVIAVIPKVAEFLKAGGAKLPAITQLMMDVSQWITLNGLTILVSLASALAVIVVLRFNAVTREWEDVTLLHLPIVGKILKLSNSALFARSMQILTGSGITLTDSLLTTSRLLRNSRCRRRVAEAHRAILQGASLGESIRPAREFSVLLRRMAAVGETTGALPETFAEVANFHEMLLSLAVKRFGMMIEPILIVLTGLIVGFVYVAFFMAIFAIAGTN